METKICTTCGKEKPKTKEFWYRRMKSIDGYRNVCKECVKNKTPKTITKEGFKTCSKCKRELPATSEYFHRSEKAHTKLKLSSRCKECLGTTFVKDRVKPRDGYKICSGCKKEKKANNKNFYTESKASDGLASKCKECRKVEDRERFQIKYYQNIELEKAKAKRYRENHKEQIKKYNKKYLSKPEAIETRRISTTRYRTKKKEIVAKFYKKDWKEALEYFNNSCAYCGSIEGTLEMDHFIPLSKGGEFTRNNVVPACKKCNCSKQNKEFEEWYKQQKCFSKERKNKIYKYLNIKGKKQQLKLF